MDGCGSQQYFFFCILICCLGVELILLVCPKLNFKANRNSTTSVGRTMDSNEVNNFVRRMMGTLDSENFGQKKLEVELVHRDAPECRISTFFKAV